MGGKDKPEHQLPLLGVDECPQLMREVQDRSNAMMGQVHGAVSLSTPWKGAVLKASGDLPSAWSLDVEEPCVSRDRRFPIVLHKIKSIHYIDIYLPLLA
jgi:hypothetical protein